MTISQKVLFPTILGLVAGFGLLVSGLVAHDDTLRTMGVSLIGGSLLQGGVGYRIPHTKGQGK